MGAAKLGTDDTVVGERGSRCPDVGGYLSCSGLGSHIIWFKYIGYVSAHWEYLGWIPPQGEPQNDMAKTVEMTGLNLGVPPTSGGDFGGGPAGGGYLCHPLPEHRSTVHCDRANYGPVPDDIEIPGDKGV